MIEQKIESLLDEKFREEEWKDCFLIDVELHQNKLLRVFIDSDTGITFEKCRKISRYLEDHLDKEEWLGQKYVLEVSSPGVDRPLKYLRQYSRNIGRKAHITLLEGENRTGTLVGVEDQHIELEEKIRQKAGKKRQSTTVVSKIPFDQIKSTIIKISFKS